MEKFSVDLFPNPGALHLFHGSPLGLDGPIRVNYRQSGQFYDFGPGFYCAGTAFPAKNILCPYRPEDYASPASLPESYCDPYLYHLRVDASALGGFTLSGPAWALFVAWNRRAITQESCPEFCDSIDALLEHTALAIGPISDDRTFLALQLFLEDNMTLDCLDAVLRSADTGIQYVFKGQALADTIEVLEAERLDIGECRRLALEIQERKKIQKNMENRIIKEKRRSGPFLSELVDWLNAERIVFPKADKRRSILNFRP